MVMCNWKGKQLWKFLEGQNCIKKILTAVKMQKKYSGTYNNKQFSFFFFHHFLKGKQRKMFPGSNLGFVLTLQNIVWKHRMQN